MFCNSLYRILSLYMAIYYIISIWKIKSIADHSSMTNFILDKIQGTAKMMITNGKLNG